VYRMLRVGAAELLDNISRTGNGAKPFAYDLALSRGVVPSRAVSLLRSSETHPFDYRFVRNAA
jgi:hypothetical protein